MPAKPEPVARTRRLRQSHLGADLEDQLYAIYRASSHSLDRESFKRRILPPGDVRVALFEGRGGELAGFSAAHILRAGVGGRQHAVFAAGVYILPGYRGGAASAIFGFTEAMRFKLREPRTPLWYVSMTSTPAVYALFARTARRFYPRRDVETPPEVEALVLASAAARGLEAVAGDPWLVQSFVRPRDPDRVRRARSLTGDPDVSFFVERNPGYADGEGTALLVAIPLQPADIAFGLARAAREQAAALFGRTGAKDAKEMEAGASTRWRFKSPVAGSQAAP